MIAGTQGPRSDHVWCLDPTAIWQWGVLERVSTGLLCTTIDLQPTGRQMLAAADHVARLPEPTGDTASPPW